MREKAKQLVELLDQKNEGELSEAREKAKGLANKYKGVSASGHVSFAGGDGDKKGLGRTIRRRASPTTTSSSPSDRGKLGGATPPPPASWAGWARCSAASPLPPPSTRRRRTSGSCSRCKPSSRRIGEKADGRHVERAADADPATPYTLCLRIIPFAITGLHSSIAPRRRPPQMLRCC